jgi:hypothetical protein
MIGRPDALAPPLDVLPNKSPADPPDDPPNDPPDGPPSNPPTDPADDPPTDPADDPPTDPLVSPRLDVLSALPCAQAARGAHARANANDACFMLPSCNDTCFSTALTREERTCPSRLELIGPPAVADAAESGIRPRRAYGCARPPADSTDTASHRSSGGRWSRSPRR